MWCLSLDGISRKVHPKAPAEVTARTAGYFVTYYLAKNGRRIEIIGQLSVNDSVQFLGLSGQSWGSELTFIWNLLDHVETTGRVSGNYSDQGWVGKSKNSNIITNVAWVLLLTPALLTFHGFLLTHAPPDAVSVTTSFVAGAKSVCVTNNTIGAIPWSIPRFITWGRTGMVRLVNIFCSKLPLLLWVTVSLPLLVWVTVYILCVISPCMSLAVTVFDS